MKSKEIRELSIEDLNKEMQNLLKEQFNFRMMKGSGQLSKTHDMKRVRRDIARIKTVIKEREIGSVS